MITAIYPGTFDPLTLAHLDLIERALRICNRLIVAIAASPNKKPLFTLPERLEMAQALLGHHTSLTVMAFDGLLANVIREEKANVILRGMRAVSDFDYEFQLASMNRVLLPNVESVFLMPAEKYMYISASLVREVASLGGDVTGFVTSDIKKRLEERFLQTST